MELMGFSVGKGLGRAGDGILEPIIAEKRPERAGLGVGGGKQVNFLRNFP